jgi:adenosylcobinamide-phosphate synthase
MTIALTIILSILLDCLLGEPKRWHPLVGFGLLATSVENHLNRTNRHIVLQFLFGVFAWSIVVVIPIFMFFIVSKIFSLWSSGYFWLDIIVLYLAIGYTSLRQHALAVFNCLIQNNTTAARTQVSMIVSRDTDQLEPIEIRKATIESVLENGNDAIFAPIFWYLIGGAYAVIIYRLANTLDAMWGYKTDRFLYFGRFTARIDDILNYIPSRLVGITYLLLGRSYSAYTCWRTQAHLLESPNAGVVMTAGAGALQLKLGGDTNYHGKLKKKLSFGTGQLPQNIDIKRSLFIIDKTLCLWCILILIVSILLNDLGDITINDVFNIFS